MTVEAGARVLYLVAHPDDAEFYAGGLMALQRQAGHVVRWVALTHGDAGHQRISGPPLAQMRRAEAEAAAAVIGAQCEVWDYPDGELQPTLALRRQVIAEIRRFQPDLVLTHRPVDYHPDHRAVGQVVQDACYMVTVPALVPEVPALRGDPIVAYMADRFTRPARVSPDVVLDVSPYIDTVAEMLHCHRCQFYEWLPYNLRIEATLPADETQRKQWLADVFVKPHRRQLATDYRQSLMEVYGPERGSAVQYAEVFEISEYAAPLDQAARQRLFTPAAGACAVNGAT